MVKTENAKEFVSAGGLIPLMQAKLVELKKLIADKRKSLTHVPEGRLRIALCRGKPQWFHVTNEENPKGCYISESKVKLARALAQKGYDENVLSVAIRDVASIEQFLKDFSDIDSIYEGLHSGRQALVNPVRLPDKLYVENWTKVKYSGRSFMADAPVLKTARGERVRSKSEVIIADTLFRMKIPYRYEYPHRMRVAPNGSKASEKSLLFYPDFTCLNVRTRREFIWEHFGLVDDAEYAKQMVSKIENFAKNGYFPGDGLIASMESAETPLSTNMVELLAQKFLMVTSNNSFSENHV